MKDTVLSLIALVVLLLGFFSHNGISGQTTYTDRQNEREDFFSGRDASVSPLSYDLLDEDAISAFERANSNIFGRVPRVYRAANSDPTVIYPGSLYDYTGPHTGKLTWADVVNNPSLFDTNRDGTVTDRDYTFCRQAESRIGQNSLNKERGVDEVNPLDRRKFAFTGGDLELARYDCDFDGNGYVDVRDLSILKDALTSAGLGQQARDDMVGTPGCAVTQEGQQSVMNGNLYICRLNSYDPLHNAYKDGPYFAPDGYEFVQKGQGEVVLRSERFQYEDVDLPGSSEPARAL